MSSCRGTYCVGEMAARLLHGAQGPSGTPCRAGPDDAFSLFYKSTPTRTATSENAHRTVEKRGGGGDNAQERGDASDGKRQGDETEDKADLAPRQEVLHGGDPLRVRVDKVEFASRQGRQARQVVRVEAVLLEALRANGGARQGRIDVVTRAVDRDTLQAIAKVRIGRVRVGHKAADDVRVDLVDEESCMQLRIVEFEGRGAVEGSGGEGI
jgi:hypothetical protein